VEITEEDPRTGHKRKVKVPIFVRYQRILAIENQVKPDVWRKYKEELFGTDTEVFAAEHYTEIDIIQRLGVDYRVWEDEYDIDLKARLIAKVQLSAIVDIVRRHDQLQRDKEKQRLQKAEAAANSKKPRKRSR
jgi:hypothetical protein